MTPFDAYRLHQAIKTHFAREDYDFFRYHGKTRVSAKTFDEGNEKWFYLNLLYKYGKDIKEFFLSVMLTRPNLWIGDYQTDEIHDTYLDFQRRRQSLEYVFRQDLIKLSEKSWEEYFSGTSPEIISKVHTKEISIETFIILNSFLGFFDAFDKKLDKIVWPVFRQKCIKYQPFIEYDKKVFKNIFMEIMCPKTQSKNT